VKSITIKIKGKVQGVWFRASTKLKAEELKVNGLVKNELDGSVYVEAEGEDEPIQKFILWCKSGPEMADVKGIIVTECEVKNFTDFTIVRK